jgi:hypothetical protein
LKRGEWTKGMRRSGILWASLVAVYALFRFWYDGGGGPLTPEEVQRYVAILQERGADPDRLDAVREFLALDTGSDFVMANFVQLRDEPGAQDAMDRYMAHMVPALLRRACHPLLAGPVRARALDLWGVENGDEWSMVGLVRYRSRRDMIEIATDPAFRDAHPHKVAALAKTIAVPVEPSLSLAGPRWLVSAALLTLGALLQLALRRPSR